MTTASKHISLPKPFLEGNPNDWFRKYEICCVANDWGNELKAKKLPTLLKGEALAIWLEMTTEQQGTYQTAKSRGWHPYVLYRLTTSGHENFAQMRHCQCIYTS